MAVDRSGADRVRNSVLRQSEPLPIPVDVVLFDMDGVLVDVAASYRRAIRETARRLAGIDVSPEQIQSYKNRGGFNDDWHLTEAVIKDAGFDVPLGEIVRVFDSLYRGASWDGFIVDEPALIREATLTALTAVYRVGMVTGRPEVEARWTLKRFGWERYFPVVITSEMQLGRGKPDPYPLELALKAFGREQQMMPARNVVYVGDAVDDILAAQNLGAWSIGVIPPATKLQPLAALLDECGAAAVIRDVNALPSLLCRVPEAESDHPE